MTPEHRLLVELAAAKQEIRTLRRSNQWLRWSRDRWKKEAKGWQWCWQNRD